MKAYLKDTLTLICFQVGTPTTCNFCGYMGSKLGVGSIKQNVQKPQQSALI